MKRVLVSGLVIATALLTGVPAAGADPLPLPPTPTVPGAPIVSLPTDALVPSYVGEPAEPRPVEHPRIPQHPVLAPNGASSMHNDAYSSDAYTTPGPLGRDVQVDSASYGVRECATVTFDSHDRIEALCGGVEGFTMMLIDPDTLQPIDQLAMPGRDPTRPSNPFTDLCGGTYFFLTHDDRAIALTTTSEIWEVSQTGADGEAPGLQKTRSWPIAPHLPEGDCVVATTVDWGGLVWFASQGGVVGTLDLATGRVRTHRLPAGETIHNSLSADETGGVYAVSTHATYRLDADRQGRPGVTWREPYDRGSQQKPGMLSQGSGTSPTLIGKRWIVVADNAEPRMHVLAYDRRRGVRHRLKCKVPVFEPGASTTENSLVAAGHSVIVENNYGYEGPQTTTLGRSTTPGIARVQFGRRCGVMWTNDSVAPTSVPKASLPSGLVYAYTKAPRPDGIDAWYVSAVDIHTGETRWRRLTGTGPQWNNHYASFYLGPEGRLFIATVTGLVRLSDSPPRTSN